MSCLSIFFLFYIVFHLIVFPDVVVFGDRNNPTGKLLFKHGARLCKLPSGFQGGPWHPGHSLTPVSVSR